MPGLFIELSLSIFIGSMASCKRSKPFFDMESCASVQQEASNTEAERVEPKRQRTAMENAGDDFEEFLALLDRIQYMKTKHTDLDIWEAISMPPEDLDVKIIKSRSRWIPSFEWEDFCVYRAKDTMAAQTHIRGPSEKNNPSSCVEREKQSIQPGNHPKTPSFGRTAYNKQLPAERFDLNVEASS